MKKFMVLFFLMLSVFVYAEDPVMIDEVDSQYIGVYTIKAFSDDAGTTYNPATKPFGYLTKDSLFLSQSNKLYTIRTMMRLESSGINAFVIDGIILTFTEMGKGVYRIVYFDENNVEVIRFMCTKN